MSRPYHGRRRRRPRKRLRYRGHGLPPRPRSHQDFGLRAFYDVILLGLCGRARRRWYNDASALMAVWYGVLGAVLGFGVLGPLGVFLGFGAGLVLGAEFLARNGYYRP